MLSKLYLYGCIKVHSSWDICFWYTLLFCWYSCDTLCIFQVLLVHLFDTLLKCPNCLSFLLWFSYTWSCWYTYDTSCILFVWFSFTLCFQWAFDTLVILDMISTHLMFSICFWYTLHFWYPIETLKFLIHFWYTLCFRYPFDIPYIISMLSIHHLFFTSVLHTSKILYTSGTFLNFKIFYFYYDLPDDSHFQKSFWYTFRFWYGLIHLNFLYFFF